MWLVTAASQCEGDGLKGHFVAAPFRFCLCCGVAYNARQISDFGELNCLGIGGEKYSHHRSSACPQFGTFDRSELPATARKLLSFTDNRQDASLQAGHFNDFIEVGILRGALFAAAERSAG